VGALAVGLGGWLWRAANRPERALAVAGGLLLFYASPITDLVGAALCLLVFVIHVVRVRAAVA
jgi:hypothetical protein